MSHLPYLKALALTSNANKSTNTSTVQTEPANVSIADELSKLKNLLDDGDLTQEEFDTQKAAILKNNQTTNTVAPQTDTDTVLYTSPASLIKGVVAVEGTLSLDYNNLYFKANNVAENEALELRKITSVMAMMGNLTVQYGILKSYTFKTDAFKEWKQQLKNVKN